VKRGRTIGLVLYLTLQQLMQGQMPRRAQKKEAGNEVEKMSLENVIDMTVIH
jgi:hypothetical protein